MKKIYLSILSIMVMSFVLSGCLKGCEQEKKAEPDKTEKAALEKPLEEKKD